MIENDEMRQKLKAAVEDLLAEGTPAGVKVAADILRFGLLDEPDTEQAAVNHELVEAVARQPVQFRFTRNQ